MPEHQFSFLPTYLKSLITRLCTIYSFVPNITKLEHSLLHTTGLTPNLIVISVHFELNLISKFVLVQNQNMMFSLIYSCVLGNVFVVRKMFLVPFKCYSVFSFGPQNVLLSSQGVLNELAR